MKSSTVLALILGCGLWTAAQACGIAEMKEIKHGTYRGVAGFCPFSGRKISCVLNPNKGWNCNGPGGSYTAADLFGAVSSACKC